MKRWGSLIGALCAILLLAASAARPQDPRSDEGQAVPRDEPSDSASQVEPAFRLVGLDDRPKLRAAVELKARQARRVLLENGRKDWPGTARIVWADEKLFREKTGFQPEHSAAAASAERMTIWINEAAWQRSTEEDRQRTLTHECAHLLLGALPGGRKLPLWANEGIVMHLAGQWSWDDHAKLLHAHFFGQLPPLSGLEHAFPREGESQVLAYRMSYAAVSVLAQSYGDEPGSVERLLLRLADPVKGPALADDFWDAFRRDGVQIATERALGSRISTGVIVLTSGSTIFLIITILVLIAWWKVKKRNAARAQEEADEEPWAESLTDEDVQDIYGDREDRWKE